jgi:DNA replication protein DnaC
MQNVPSSRSTTQSPTGGRESSKTPDAPTVPDPGEQNTEPPTNTTGTTPDFDARARRREEYERRQQQNQVRELWDASRVPGRHAKQVDLVRKSDAGDWVSAYRRARDRLGSGVIFALLGPRGTGKTQAAAALIRDACEASHSALYCVAGDLFDELRDELKSGNAKALRKRIRRVGLLVLDEIHEIAGSDWELRELVGLIDARYREELDTLLVGNSTRDALGELLGPSIVSRMRETGAVIEFTDRFRP